MLLTTLSTLHNSKSKAVCVFGNSSLTVFNSLRTHRPLLFFFKSCFKLLLVPQVSFIVNFLFYNKTVMCNTYQWVLRSKYLWLLDVYFLFLYFSITKYSLVQIQKLSISILTFVKVLSKLFYDLLIGLQNSLEIIGYARRAWYLPAKDSFVYLKVGKSFLSKVFIPLNLTLTLVKKRLMRFFSFDSGLLYKVCFSIFSLKPMDPYKGSCIKYLTVPLRLKQRKVKD